MVDQKIILGAGIVIVLIVGYIALSFASLEYNEYGLDYSDIWKEVDKNYYTGGIHFLGFQHSFIKFPKSVITIDFTDDDDGDRGIIESRTSDGLEVFLEISYQYELKPAKLYDLYMEYGENYEDVMIRLAVDTINKVSNKYTAYNFFNNRTIIGEVMEDELDNVLESSMYCLIKFFQLKTVDLPDDFEDAIQLTEVKKQDIEKAKAEMAKVEVEIETKLQLAEQNKKIILNNANGEVNKIISNNQAHVDAYNNTETLVIEGLSNMKTLASMSNDDILSYLKSSIIENYSGDNLIIALED